MNPQANVFTLPPQAPFLRHLAAWLLGRYGEDAASLARVRVFLPNRRACRGLREAMLDLADGRPMLLPRIQPIGEVEGEGLPADILSEEMLRDIPPAIDSRRRLLLLSRLVMQFESGREAPGGSAYHTAHALQLARQLASFMDEVAREGLDMDGLNLLAPADLARHWQQTLDFLQIISVHWPEALRSENVIGPVEHRNRLLGAIVQRWHTHPPDYPVIAAGSTGTQPATAALLACIARMPEGMVLLPGLDKEMPDAEWELLEATHPQYTLKQLLKHIGVTRKQVDSMTEESWSDRLRCFASALQPAPATAQWSRSALPVSGMGGVRTLIAETEQEEARLIAIALREALEERGKTAALVTPNRTLARRVAAQMDRFGIEIDDSAGKKLLHTPAGIFMKLVTEAVWSGASPVALLALLRHPLLAAEREPSECRNLSRELEKEYLRGVRRAPGLSALLRLTKDTHPPLYDLLSYLEREMKTLMGWLGKKAPVSPEVMLKEHIRLAEALAQTPNESGAARLWAGDDGNTLAEALASVARHLPVLPPVPPSSYAGLFETLLGEETYRPRFGSHPRLHILSPIEARLQSYDLVVLGGLNEGQWPQHPSADPWMSRPMRETFGLPPHERAIGQSAHDFFQLCAGPQVLLTRARKEGGAPTVPSRWLVRLATLLSGKDKQAHESLSALPHYQAASNILEEPLEMEPASQPRPTPPVDARPTGLRATAIDRWVSDPYMIYAQYVLGLSALPPLDEEPTAADFGRVVHEAMQLFSERWPKELPDNIENEITKAGEEAFRRFHDQPMVFALWWPKFQVMAGWLAQQEKERRAANIEVIAERKGRLPLPVDGEAFTLTTRIDRVELKGGEAAIIDYKTGSVPSETELKSGAANQLPVEALIVSEGTLEPPLSQRVKVADMRYWKLAGKIDGCKDVGIESAEDAAALIEQCKQRLTELIRLYRNPAQAYVAQANPKEGPNYNDYAHLTRRQEWGEG